MNDPQIEFQEVYQQYYQKIVAYLKRLVGELEAEDTAQETFVKIGRSLETFRGESSLSTWIYRIATNTALDHLRKRSSRIVQSAEDGGLTEEDFAGFIDATPLHDTRLMRENMNECIRGIVDTLAEDYRAVLVLSEFEDLSNPEIAEVLGISLETTKIRLHRARTKLRKALETNCIFYRDERNEFCCDRKTPALKFVQ